MLATLMPLFGDNMEVSAYSVFAQKVNNLLQPMIQSTMCLDGAGEITGLEIVNRVGAETLSDDKEIFIEINSVSLFADIQAQCSQNPEQIVLLIDYHVEPNEENVARIKELSDMGFKFAMRKLKPLEFENYRAILDMCSYILLDHTKIDIQKARLYFNHQYPDMKLCAVNVNSREEYDTLTEQDTYDLFEGEFFRMPVTKGEKELSPLKATYIQLLNVVNTSDFELTDAADVIGQDAALVVNLLEMVNHMTANRGVSSVRHAAALLGQRELKKWITTAVTRELCADRPSEIARMSMVRAKFAENLAEAFELKPFSAELFLLGLFSVLDQILNKPMKECLEMVKVNRDIWDALLFKRGRAYPVLDFVLQYESASWQEVSRQMVLQNIEMNGVYEAYLDALEWYREIVSIGTGKVRA